MHGFTLKVASRHSRESGNPARVPARHAGPSTTLWVPAFAGTTGKQTVVVAPFGGPAKASAINSESSPTFALTNSRLGGRTAR